VPSLIECARTVWETFERGGTEGLRALVADDVRWQPWGAGDRVLGGCDEVEAWYREQRVEGRASTRTVHGWEEHGPCVLVHGSLRVYRDGGFIDVQPAWVFFFSGERLVQAVSYDGREHALAAIAEHVRSQAQPGAA
jgi:ketosteroid isomerase-like protein